MKIARMIAIALLSASAMACTAQKSNFTIIGDITGLQIGDTIEFSTIDLPSWKDSTAFTIIVDKEGKVLEAGLRGEELDMYISSKLEK